MTNVRLSSLAALTLVTCVLLGASQCQRFHPRTPGGLKVEASPADIEWVIVDTHDVGVGGQWVAKLTPHTDRKLIKELIASINIAVHGEQMSCASEGFVVFKIKGGGIEDFNFADIGSGPVEIRPGFWSRRLAGPLRKIAAEKIGWNRDHSLPRVKVKRIDVWQYESPVTAFRPDSPSFAPLVAAASEILKALDPRWCMQDPDVGDPRRVAAYQGAPQFILFLEKPLKMYKLIMHWENGAGYVTRIRYETFRSSVIALYMARFHLGIGGLYVAFLPEEHNDVAAVPGRDKTNWHEWDLVQAASAARTMGKPDAYKAFTKLLEEYEKIAPSPR